MEETKRECTLAQFDPHWADERPYVESSTEDSDEETDATHTLSTPLDGLVDGTLLPEIWDKILEYLDTPSLLAFGQASRSVRALCATRKVHRRRLLEYRQSRRRPLALLAEMCGEAGLGYRRECVQRPRLKFKHVWRASFAGKDDGDDNSGGLWWTEIWYYHYKRVFTRKSRSVAFTGKHGWRWGCLHEA